MNREEAIKYLKEIKDECNDTIHKVKYVTQEEALEMAIKALEQEPTYYPPCIDCNKKMDEIRHAYDKLKEQEPSGDLISRQAVIDACDQSINILEAVDRIMDLPSVEQEPKTGHWIKSRDCYGNYHFTCSECGNDIATQYADNWEDKYCSECGAKMVETQESEG